MSDGILHYFLTNFKKVWLFHIFVFLFCSLPQLFEVGVAALEKDHFFAFTSQDLAAFQSESYDSWRVVCLLSIKFDQTTPTQSFYRVVLMLNSSQIIPKCFCNIGCCLFNHEYSIL